MSVVAWPALCALVIAGIAAFTDLRARIIPNWLTLPAIVSGLVLHLSLGGLHGALLSVLAALLCFAPAYFLFVRGALGGGDVKLFAALGAWLGVRDGLELELTAFVLVAAFALWSMAWDGRLRALLQASFRATLHLVLPSRFERPLPTEGCAELPMGGAILGASLAVLIRSVL
jgi:prepilin peptidase CpaA